MKLNQEQTIQRVTKYMTERLLPLAQNPTNRFKIGFALPIVPQMTVYYWKMGRDLGIVDEQGLDTERLSACLESGLKQVEALTIQGFKFNASDARDFISCLES